MDSFASFSVNQYNSMQEFDFYVWKVKDKQISPTWTDYPVQGYIINIQPKHWAKIYPSGTDRRSW